MVGTHSPTPGPHTLFIFLPVFPLFSLPFPLPPKKIQLGCAVSSLGLSFGRWSKKRILDSEILAGGDADSVLTFHPDKLVGSTNGRNGPYKPQQTSGPRRKWRLCFTEVYKCYLLVLKQLMRYAQLQFYNINRLHLSHPKGKPTETSKQQRTITFLRALMQLHRSPWPPSAVTTPVHVTQLLMKHITSHTMYNISSERHVVIIMNRDAVIIR